MADQNNQSIAQTYKLNASIKESIEADPQPALAVESRRDRGSINPVHQEDLLLSPEQLSARKVARLYKKLQIGSLVCIVLSLIFVFALPPIITSMIKSQAINQVILRPDNEGVWAHFPGDTDTHIVRNYTFFKLDNEEGLLYKQQKPVFREIEGYKISELEDFEQIEYIDDGNRVKFLDWLHFEHRADSRSMTEPVSILNMASLGYWYTLKKSRPTLILQQGLALLVKSLEDTILPNLFGQGIASQYLMDFKTAQTGLLGPAGISEEKGLFMWNDVNFGLSNQNHLIVWVDAAIDSRQPSGFKLSADSDYLKNYFVLNDFQIEFIMRKMLEYVDSLSDLLLLNHYCDEVEPEQCTGRYLAIRQLAQSKVTLDTPPVSTVIPTLTICRDNVTCKGYNPELSAYYQLVYRKEHPEADPKMQFDTFMVGKWMNYNQSVEPELDYNTQPNCLLHIGNLDQLWLNGQLYDSTGKSSYLANIQQQFELPNSEQTLVFWNWIKYMTDKFVRQGANNTRLGISTLFSSGLYEGFAGLEGNLQKYLLTKLLAKKITGTDCHSFFQTSLGIANASSPVLNSICNHYNNSISGDAFAEQMQDICLNKFSTNWDGLKGLGPSLSNMEEFCDASHDDASSFGRMLHSSRLELQELHNCDARSTYCSDFELATIQWTSSNVTMHVPLGLVGDLPSTTTFSDWHSGQKPIEYSHFITMFSPEEQKTFQIFSLNETFKLMSFDAWFSSSVALSSLIAGKLEGGLKKYVRYVCINFGMNGFTTTRNAEKFIFGYEDEFLKVIRKSPPPFGGDPSVQSYIAFNDLNLTKEETTMRVVLKTGKNDYRDLFQYSEINGYPYLTQNYTRFDGNHTYNELVTPWATNDYFYGTNAKIFAPNQFESNNISLYIPNIQRYGSGPYSQSLPYERFGIPLGVSFVGEQLLESTETSNLNEKYYQTYEAVFNETSVVGVPLFLTKNHFMNCTPNWTTFVDIYDESKAIKYEQTSLWDDSYLIVEPYTGVSFQSVLHLQSNYLHERDELFDYAQTALLPVFSVYRSGNLTESKAKELFGPLMGAINARITIRYVGVALLVLSVLILAFCTYRVKKLKEVWRASIDEQSEEVSKSEKKSQMGISLQPVHEPLLETRIEEEQE